MGQLSVLSTVGSSGSLSRREWIRATALTGAVAAAPGVVGADPHQPGTTHARQPDQPGQPAGSPGAGPGPACGQGAGFYRLAVGTAQVTVVSDGAFQLSPAYPTLAVNGTRENVERALRREFLSPEGVPTHVNALLVRTGTDTVLVDAGCGPLFGPTTGHLIENLARAGTRPDEITAVLLTHLHGDHIGGLLDEAGRSRFPKAELLLHADEHAFWSAEDPDLSASALPAERRAGMVRAAKRLLGAARFTLLRGAAQVRPGIVLVPAPGHTPGHCGLLIDGGGDNQLLSITDAIHNAAIQLAHPEYYVAFDTAPEQAVEARKRLLDRAAAERVLVTGAHLPFPAIGHVRRRDEESREAGAAYEWVPEVWRWHA